MLMFWTGGVRACFLLLITNSVKDAWALGAMAIWTSVISIFGYLVELIVVILELKLLLDDIVAHSLEAKEALQALELLERTVLVMNAAPVHDAFAIEEFEVWCDEDAIFFKGSVADVFTVLHVSDFTIDIIFFE